MKTKSMSRFTLILAFSMVFMSEFVVASTPASECAATIWQKFKEKVSYPEYAYKQAVQGDVTVIFTVSDEGKIIVKDIRATDIDLANYIKEVISTVYCPELDNASVYEFKVVFHFKLI
jgi:hypothetical protein